MKSVQSVIVPSIMRSGHFPQGAEDTQGQGATHRGWICVISPIRRGAEAEPDPLGAPLDLYSCESCGRQMVLAVLWL